MIQPGQTIFQKLQIWNCYYSWRRCTVDRGVPKRVSKEISPGCTSLLKMSIPAISAYCFFPVQGMQNSQKNLIRLIGRQRQVYQHHELQKTEDNGLKLQLQIKNKKELTRSNEKGNKLPVTSPTNSIPSELMYIQISTFLMN